MAQYIDKDIVKAEIEGLKRNTFTNFDEGVNAAAQILLDFLDALEVKEVDLEKEIDDYMNEHFSECADGVLISDANSTELTLLDATSIARHFYELGLKGQLKNK